VKTRRLLLVAMFVVCVAGPLVSAKADELDVTPLNNKDVLTMVDNKVPAEAIVKAIQKSACTFDTFPPVLRELRRRGVPDAVLQAMVQAPYGPSTANNSADDLGEQVIYHYTEQLKPYLAPVASGGLRVTRQMRGRSIRARDMQ
jgi:hypothetical protein